MEARSHGGYSKMNTVAVLLATLILQGFCEAINYFLVYSQEKYKSLKEDIARLEKKGKGAKKKEVVTAAASKKSAKREKVARSHDGPLKKLQQEMGAFRMRSGLVVAVVSLVGFSYLRSKFTGVVVAKLPFEPFPFFARMTHMGIEGDDLTDCSMAFLYTLSIAAFRSIVLRAFGIGSPGDMASGMWEQVQEAQARLGVKPQ